LIPAITDDLIAKMVQTPGMLRSGHAYFLQGRVGEVDVDHELGVVTAEVRGSGRNRYVTSILFYNDTDDVFDDGTGPESIDPDSECSCPLGYGCKHAAALLYALREALAEEPPNTPSVRITAAAHEQARLSGPLGEWLDRAVAENLTASIPPEPVRFVIEPVRAFKQGGRGKGAPSKPLNRYLLQVRAWRRRAHAPEFRMVHYYELHQSPGIIDPQALRLLSRMSPITAGGDFGSDRAPSGRHGWQWLCEAAAAGLLVWKSFDGPAITVGPGNLKTKLDWQVLDDGRLMLVPQGIGEQMAIFAGDPPVFLNESRLELGLIDAGLAPSLTGRLLAMPPLTAAQIPTLEKRWSEIAGDQVPAPRIAGLVDLGVISPRPVLRFMSDKLERLVHASPWYRPRSQRMPFELARLEFDYAGHRVRPPEPAAQVIVGSKSEPVRLRRDLAAEQAAADRLAQTGLSPLALHDEFKTKPHQAWDHALIGMEPGNAARGGYPELLIDEVEALRSEGWLIEYAPDWPHRYQPLASEDARLELTQPQPAGKAEIDWFDVELAALVDGERVDILPALRRLLADGGEHLLERGDEHRLPLQLGDGRFTAIRLGAVRPLVETLLRLALADRSASPLRLNRYDLGAVHEIAGSGLAWTEAGALRQLASALHGPDRASYAPPAGLEAELRPYQEVGAAWLQALHGAGLGGILADDMGLGKTLQAIAHVIHVRGQEGAAAPALIVAPTSVLPNWQAELARFAPDLDCLLWHGADRQRLADRLAQAPVILTSYPLLARDKALLGDLDCALVVLDEAHVLKNPATIGFKAAAELKSRQTIALSGTPIENRLNDVWALASLTNRGLLGSFKAFRKAYRTPIEKHGDRTAQAALGRRLRPFMLRRTKDEVAADLPAKTLIPERIELSDAQLRLYESQRLLMNARVREEIDRVGLMRSQIVVLDAMLKLRQICCDPTLLPRGVGEGVASAKRARLLEMLPELLGEGRRVIVFSQFTAMLDRIAADLDAAGLAYEQLRGTTRDRARPVRRFQQGEVPLILVSLKAGGAGINLTAADTVILYDPWWNPAIEAQAIDRAHRIGQNKPVFVHRLIATGTIEEKILALQERKQGLADMLWSEQARAGGVGLDDEDIAFLLG
jgi:superfamily II DNA or RNA helicase